MSSNSLKVTLVAILFVGLFVVACGGGTAVQTVVVPQTVVVSQTAVPAGQATAAPKAPEAQVEIVPVAAKRGRGGPDTPDPNVITGTIKIITDTVVGESSTTIAMGATGLPNVPINVPVHVKCSTADSKETVKPLWTLRKPADSKADFKDKTALATEFTPDVAGAYQVVCALANDAFPSGGEVSAVQIHAGTFVGTTDGKCATCHAQKVEEWSKTGHAKIFTEMVDNKRTPDVGTHYTESCASCHTTGYFVSPVGDGANGFKEIMTKAGWKFPTWKQIDAAGKKTGPSNWASAPAPVKNMANIQCEQCHGPASDHVKNGSATMSASQDEGVCNVCHNGGGNHLKGTDLQNAAHADKTAAAWNEPTGPGEQACVRCHSGNGYVSFLDDPKNQAAWDNTKQTVVCSTCHDPHADENVFQLRIVSKPIELPFEVKKDVGLSATCYECHNSRQTAANAIKGSFPHYSSVAEFLSDTGGVDYGKTIQNSPHGMMVGIAPIANPAAKDDPEAGKFLFSKTDDTKGNIPGPCVTCHMWPTITDAKDPNWHKVGSHSFNTVSPDGKFDYTAACKTCHTNMKDDFNFTAKADYDGNGKVEGVQDEVTGLLNVLWKALEGKGVKKVDTGYPYATLPKDADGKIDPKIANAWYNFRTVYGVMWGAEGQGNQGKSQAIHNFSRAVSLLQLSYKDLTGNDVPGATILVK